MFKNLKRRMSNSKPVEKRQGPTPSKRKYLRDSEKTPVKIVTKKKDVLANDGLADDQDHDDDKITTLVINYIQYIC